jgi:hypothetical protein
MEIKDAKDRHARFYHGGKLILTTKRSHGKGPIEGPVQHLIRQQLKLSSSEFGDLIACPLTLGGYIEILRKKGWIPQEAAAPPSLVQQQKNQKKPKRRK